MKYTIGKVSKLFRIGPDALRHYDKLGLLKPEVDPSTGYRYYEMRHLLQLDFILRAKYLELPLSEIKNILESEDLKAYELLLSAQKQTIREKMNHLNKLDSLLTQNQKVLKEVIHYQNNYSFSEFTILDESQNYYLLNEKEYMEDAIIMNILGDICSEHFDCPSETDTTDNEYSIYTVTPNNQVIENKDYVCIRETPRNKAPLDSYFLKKYGNIPHKKIEGNYIIAHFYGTTNELKEYILLLNDYFKGNSDNEILVRFKFHLPKKISSEYYWEILYKL